MRNSRKPQLGKPARAVIFTGLAKTLSDFACK